jgi:dienelactone hydrolase
LTARAVLRCPAFRLLLPGVFAGVVALTLSGAAFGTERQSWLETAYSDDGNLGPAEAVGAVIWSHGRSADTEDSTAPTPPYLAILRQGGWDTFRFNRMRAADTFANSTRSLLDEVHRLRQRGYRQVALAGQSFGAFLSLMAADSSDEVDAVIATAPAAYGSFSQAANSWRNNATRLYPLLEQVRHARIMLFYFNSDDFDPGGRGEQSRLILRRRQLPFVIVDRPPKLTSHWAAGTADFAGLYGNCILGFIDSVRVNDGAECRGGSFWAGDTTTNPLRPGLATTAAALEPRSQ